MSRRYKHETFERLFQAYQVPPNHSSDSPHINNEVYPSQHPSGSASEDSLYPTGTIQINEDGNPVNVSQQASPATPPVAPEPAAPEIHLPTLSQFAPANFPHKELQTSFAGTARLWRGGDGHLAEFSHAVHNTETQFLRSSVGPSLATLLAKPNPTPYTQAKSAGTVFISHANTGAALASSVADTSMLGHAKFLGLSFTETRPLVLLNPSGSVHAAETKSGAENLFRAFFQTIRTLPFSPEAFSSKVSSLAASAEHPQFLQGIAESLTHFFSLPLHEQENLLTSFRNYFQSGNLPLWGFVQNLNSSGVQGLLQGVGHLMDALLGTRFVQTFPQFWPMLGLFMIQTNLLPQTALNAALLAELSALMSRRKEKLKERRSPKLRRADRVSGKDQAMSTDNYPDEGEEVDLLEAWFANAQDNPEAFSFMWH